MFPPGKYPVRLQLWFSHRDLHVVDRLKKELDGMPKSRAKYRKTANAYKTSYFLKCYFDRVATLEPVARKLEGENLWKVTVEGDNQKLTPGCLVGKARTACP